MFGRNKDAAASAPIPPFTPGPEPSAAQRQFFARGGKIAVDRNRWFVIAMVMAAGYIAVGIAFWQLIPLKSVTPILLSQQDGGRVVPFAVADGKPFQPGEEVIAYHVKEWAANLWSINASTLDITQKAALRKIAGNAVIQVDAWLKANNPYVEIKNNPTTIRQIEPVSLNFLKRDSVLFRFREISYAASGAVPRVKVVALTLNFVLRKPESRDAVFENPLGLFITNVNATEEAGGAAPFQ